ARVLGEGRRDRGRALRAQQRAGTGGGRERFGRAHTRAAAVGGRREAREAARHAGGRRARGDRRGVRAVRLDRDQRGLVVVFERGARTALEYDDEAALIAVKPDRAHPAAIAPCAAPAGVPGGLTRFAPSADGRRPRMGAPEPFAPAAGACTLLRAQRAPPVPTALAEDPRG
ncbi:hypothetical protein, partial [Burkholderia pseudomallei]|uniref:hypothetical protein n=1 Tax=Burkholderia pseudomallei TaxID=28450 RepID=UPI0021565A00